MYTYDPKCYIIMFAGKILEGFGETDMLSFTPQSDVFDDVVGVDGEVTRIRSHDSRATVEITLAESSACNQFLSDLMTADTLSKNGVGIGEFRVIDVAGTDEIKAPQAWLMNNAAVELKNKPGPRVWRIRLANYKSNQGGRTPHGG